MARIAFLLLAHRDPARLVAKANSLTAHGDYVVIHFDRSAKAANWNALRSGLARNDRVRFASRVRCGWGMYSLVQASLNLIEKARHSFSDITHYYLLSGDCYPTKSRGYLDRFLTDDRDHIEVNDFFESGWIKTGLKEDRLIYRHWFNERERSWLFYKSLNLQRRFRMTREIPEGLTMRIGSQWWALRASTIERLMKFLKGRKDVTRFFSTTWIPDETFFQTLVGHLIPLDQLTDKPPTHLKFTDYGMPAVFHANQGDYLHADPGAFARKISPHADALHQALLGRFEEWNCDAPEGTGSTNLFGYLTSRGRHGQRYAPRFWETAIGQRRRARLLIVVSKLWHVGEAMEKAIADMTGVRRLGYLFDEDRDLDVSLGGLETGLAKRNRHRVALLNLVFDALETDRLMLCIDPSRADAIAEMANKIGEVRILMIDRPIPESHIHGHAIRTGLISDGSGDFEVAESLTALRHEFAAELTHLRDNHGGRLFVNDLDRDREANIVDLGRFLHASRAEATALAHEAEKWAG